MAGDKIFSKEELNNGLLKIVKILHKNNITDWFLVYGTLLGIARDNSCINNDDDIDIICNIKDRNKIKECLKKNGYTFTYGYGIGNFKNILKTVTMKGSPTVDFYCSTVDDKGNYNDTWEEVIWSNCYVNNKKEFIKKEWNGTIVHLPNNYEEKLKNRYGESWKTPIRKENRWLPKWRKNKIL
jgi:phosphorylcholine metabolism protein LicD